MFDRALINGIAGTTIDIGDRGLHYGDGLFETMAVTCGSVHYLDEHLARLKSGCLRLRMPAIDYPVIEREVRQLSQGADRAVIKIILTRGRGGRGYQVDPHSVVTRIIARFPYPKYPENYWEDGVKLTLCKTPLAGNPLLAGIKHLNRLEQVLARNEWHDPSIVEGIMLDTRQYVVEGTMSNLFFVLKGILHTPSVAECGVEGVMRGAVLQKAAQLGLAFEIADFKLQDIYNADEVFITNSIIGIWPVKQIQQQVYGIGDVTVKLSGLLNLKQ